MISVSGYLISSQEANKLPLPPQAEFTWWYQFYFATERGRAGYEKYRRDFNKLIWRLASPKWSFDDATFERTASAFDNPDHVAIVIHNYRWRLGLAGQMRKTAVRGPTSNGSGGRIEPPTLGYESVLLLMHCFTSSDITLTFRYKQLAAVNWTLNSA
jgi:hypothetical protein